ncbi:type I pullulanase [Paenibacillus terrigena]|uniref:type I pullulanase n=1 Tax=Paenibacillus terrigena TaxID=369333 RepID=UPI0028D6E291|nr:type I pullulanase [Paenibacillus terrigena]
MSLKWKSRMSKLLVFVLVWGMFTGLLNSNANAEEAAVMDVQSPSSSGISWNEVAILGTSATGGWNGYQLGQLQLTNDHDNLYFRVTGVKVEDWQNINIALNINGQDSGQSDNPLHQQYRFNGPSRPQYQIVLDAGSKLSKNQIGLYASSQLDAPLLSAANPQGADFRGNAQSGFEGSIPLSVLGLKNGDQLRGAVILSGDNANEHGAFDIIPESPVNTVATDWNMKPSPNVISEYTNSYIVALNHSPIVDGNRDSVWEAVYTLGDSSTLNEIGLKSEIHNFKMTNDSRNLYFWLDAKVPNWAEYGQMIDIALQVNGEDSGIGVNPIGAPYNFNAAPAKPQYHITMRVKNDNEVQEAALYASNDFAHPLAKYGANLNGAMFAVDRSQGFEASIPLKLLGLKNGDQLRSIVVLTGNNNVEHGAFNVIPEHPLNQLARTWDEQHQPNTQQVYMEPYTITGFSGKLDVVNSSPVNHEAKAPNDGKITVIWTENIRVLQPDGMQMLDQDDQVVPAQLTAENNQMLLQSNVKLQYGHTYKVLVAADAVEGQDTSTRNPAYAFSFTTKTRPSMKQAFVDHPDEVKVILNEVIPNLKYSQFAVFNGGVKLNGTASQGAKSDEVVIQLQDKITDVADPYVVRYEDAGADAYVDQPLTMRSILNTYVYDGNDLGVTYQAAASTFKVWAPTAKQVTVLLYDNPAAAQDEPTSTRVLTRDEQSGVWSQIVQGNLEGKYYMYLVEFASGLKTYALDPYAKASAVNSEKSAIVNLAATDPAGWNPDIKPPMVEPTDAVLYELHTRDFSMDENSGISANHRGKFMAFTETGTTVPGRPDVPTGIDHLKELGITHVHLLPFYDFGSVNERKVDDPTAPERKFNWGYDPVNYNVPEGSYATNSSDEDPAKRITEMKSMVQALHNNGIRIVLDVVYNHTYTTGLTSEFSVFDKIVPGYFYRSNERGEFTNGSGVGNEVASERPMVSKYIKDSVKYLAEEYNVDGFRFDLMALIDINTMKSLTKELKQADPSMIIYGEPWSGGTSALPSELLTVKGKQRGTGFAVFNDNIRGAIKGGSDDDSTGFATGASGQEEAIIRGVEGSTSEITDNPTETINYVTAHDNLNLWDKVLKTQHKDGQIKTDPFATLTEANVLDNETVKRSLLANGIIFTSQGIPFMHAGDEMLRSKFGDHNSYASSDEVNKMRWEQKAKYQPVFDYVQGLIELRKTHPAFRMTTKQAVAANLQVMQKKDNIVAFQLKNFANQDPWNNIVVIYNANMNAKEVTLPSSAWKVVVDHTAAGVETIRTVSGNKVQVEGLSMLVLYDQAIDYAPSPTTIEVTPNLMGLEKGMSRVAAAVVKDQKGNKMQGQAVIWSSSNEQIATVTSAGKVTAKGNGKAVITASFGQIQGSVTVEVTTLVPTSITVSGTEQLYTTRSVALSAEVKDQYDAEMIGATVAWSSSNPSVATVDRAGKVTGLSAGTVTITAKAGNASAHKKLTIKPLVKRYIQLNYVRPQGDFTDWAVWVWDTGAQNGKIDFSTKKGDTATANIEIGSDTGGIGFIIYRGDWAEKDPSTDRFITTNLNDTVTKVTSYSGQVEMKVAPSVIGPMLENGNITFVYRDDEIFLHGGLDRITKMQVTVNGTAYEMTYDAEHERFVYTLDNVASGNYTYTFTMTKDGKTTTFNDPKNEVDGQSVVTYSKPKVTVTASVAPNTIHAGQNRVMSVQLKADSKVEYREIYADLTSLGGSSHLLIDPQLLEQTIAVEDHVLSGMKTIGITAVDSFGNKHQGTAEVQVVTKPKGTGSLDFDWDEARIYFALTDRFSDGDQSNNGIEGQDYNKSHPEAYHGGDFRGLINKLDYLQSLGVNTLWITPIVDNIEFNKGVDFGSTQYAYHGYWAKDFEKLDEHLGDLDTFKELINKAHDRGIKLMIDVVLNHTGYGLKPDDDRPSITEADKARFAGMLRTDGVSANEQVIRGEVEGLPDFKTEEEAVRNQVIQWQTDWLERAKTDRGDTIDYYRVDTVKHVDDTTWKAFKNKLTTINPNFKLIGEYYGGNADNMGTYLNSGEMDSLLDFGFKDLALDFVNGRLDQVEQKLQARDAKINNTSTLGQFLSSHDEDGFLSEKIGGDRGKLMVAAALQVTAKGQPVIYYGEELGRSGKNAGNMGEGNFSFNRTDMPWEMLTEEKFLHDHYAKLLQIRSNYSKVISKGSRSKIAGGDTEKYLVFDKMYQDEHLVIGLNTDRASKEQITLKVPFDAGKVVIDEYGGQLYTVNDQNEIKLTLPGRDQGGTVILAEKKPTNPEQPEPPTSKPSQSSTTPAPSVSETGVERTALGVILTPSKTVQVTDADGTKLMQATLSNDQVVKGLQLVASTANEQHTLIVQLKEAANARIVLPNVTVQSILQALRSDPQLKVIVQSANIRYELPMRGLDWMGTVKAMQQAKPQDVSLVVLLREAPDAASIAFKDAAARIGAVAAGPLMEMTVFAQTEGQTLELHNFGSIYTMRELTLKGEIDAKHISAVHFDPILKQLSFVPALFKKDAQHTQVTMQRNGSSLYGIITLNKQFSDLKGHWAAKEIELLASKLIVNGDADGRFAPSRHVTRAEFTAMLVRALGLTQSSSSESRFTDVASHAWYTDVIHTAVEAKLVRGYEDGSFKPDTVVTREQMAQMITNALRYVQPANMPEGGSLNAYRDQDQISDWAKAAFAIGHHTQILNGFEDQTLRPNAAASRAEAVVMLKRMLTYLKFIS